MSDEFKSFKVNKRLNKPCTYNILCLASCHNISQSNWHSGGAQLVGTVLQIIIMTWGIDTTGSKCFFFWSVDLLLKQDLYQ